LDPTHFAILPNIRSENARKTSRVESSISSLDINASERAVGGSLKKLKLAMPDRLTLSRVPPSATECSLDQLKFGDKFALTHVCFFFSLNFCLFLFN
jgi:hypothetical protein